MKAIHYYIYTRAKLAFAALLLALLASCAGDYRNAIPKGSTALLAVDAPALLGEGGAEASQSLAGLCKMLRLGDLTNTGIDFSETLYGFETADGTLGLVLPVSSEGDVDEWMATLGKMGFASQSTEKKGYKFAVLGGSFLVGYSSQAMVAVGPVVAAGQADMQRRVAKWLDNGDDDGIKGTKLYDKLEAATGALRLVARSDALPEQFAALLTLGAPKGTQPQEVYAALSLQPTGKGYIEINGGAFSLDDTVEQALRKAKDHYKPIKGTLLSAVPGGALFALACGVQGDQYLQVLRSNEEIRTMLFGANTVLDIDKMLRSVDGDLLLGMEAADGAVPAFFLLAEQTSTDWLNDVAYWRKTCPNGTTIAPTGAPGSYVLRSPDYTLRFGINEEKHLYIANRATEGQPLPCDIRKALTGKRLGLVVNVANVLAAEPGLAVASPLVGALLGHDVKIVYTIE